MLLIKFDECKDQQLLKLELALHPSILSIEYFHAIISQFFPLCCYVLSIQFFIHEILGVQTKIFHLIFLLQIIIFFSIFYVNSLEQVFAPIHIRSQPINNTNYNYVANVLFRWHSEVIKLVTTPVIKSNTKPRTSVIFFTCSSNLFNHFSSKFWQVVISFSCFIQFIRIIATHCVFYLQNQCNILLLMHVAHEAITNAIHLQRNYRDFTPFLFMVF